MKDNIVRKLNELNKEFYEKTADSWDSKRPVRLDLYEQMFSYLKNENPNPKNILDVGCGNGRNIPLFRQHFPNTKYIGLDNSDSLINIVKERYQDTKIDFINMDIFEYFKLPNETKYDLITMIALVHHIPGRDNRIKLLSEASQLLSKNGLLVITFWKFIESERIKNKIIDWGEIVINSDEVEKNDYLLGWDNQNGMYRYCHYHDDKEINYLVSKSNLETVHSFDYKTKLGTPGKTVICRKK